MFRPQRVLISRHGGETRGERVEHVPGLMMAAPQLGESFQMFLETGLIMRTTPVTHVGHEGHDLILETRNSRYRLELAS